MLFCCSTCSQSFDATARKVALAAADGIRQDRENFSVTLMPTERRFVVLSRFGLLCGCLSLLLVPICANADAFVFLGSPFGDTLVDVQVAPSVQKAEVAAKRKYTGSTPKLLGSCKGGWWAEVNSLWMTDWDSGERHVAYGAACGSESRRDAEKRAWAKCKQRDGCRVAPTGSRPKIEIYLRSGRDDTGGEAKDEHSEIVRLTERNGQQLWQNAQGAVVSFPEAIRALDANEAPSR